MWGMGNYFCICIISHKLGIRYGLIPIAKVICVLYSCVIRMSIISCQ